MNILITGTSSGFGKLMVQSLLKDNKDHQIIATMRDMSGKNKSVADELESLDNVTVMDLDVTDQASIDQAVAQAMEKFGTIDVLVNNAGVISSGPLESYTIEQFQRLFDINVYGVLRMNNAVLPGMREKKNGLIINISSGLGFFPIPLAVPYCASKAALESIVRGSYHELMSFGIENVLIEPGAYPTEIMEKAGIPGDRADIIPAYKEFINQASQNMANMQERMARIKPDPQVIADKTVELINLPKGQRPIQSFVDVIAGQDLADDIVATLQQAEKKWTQSYGFGG